MIRTARLDLIPATTALTRAALDGREALARVLGAAVPASWPPEYLDRSALEFTISRLEEGPRQAGWWLHFVLLREPGGPTLIGSAGYAGPPDPDGVVEIGYGIVVDRRRQGYASEVAMGLVAKAFSLPAVRSVIAETLPDLAPSIGVLQKCGFRPGGEASAPGAVRFELHREDFDSHGPAI